MRNERSSRCQLSRDAQATIRFVVLIYCPDNAWMSFIPTWLLPCVNWLPSGSVTCANWAIFWERSLQSALVTLLDCVVRIVEINGKLYTATQRTTMIFYNYYVKVCITVFLSTVLLSLSFCRALAIHGLKQRFILVCSPVCLSYAGTVLKQLPVKSRKNDAFSRPMSENHLHCSPHGNQLRPIGRNLCLLRDFLAARQRQ